MVSGPSLRELELLQEARDLALRAREGWLAAQLGSLNRSLADVTADPHGVALEAALAEAASAYRLACQRRWPAKRRTSRPSTPRLPGL